MSGGRDRGAHAPLVGDVVGGEYVLKTQLGQDGIGTVYLARHSPTEREVVLRWVAVDDEVVGERILSEARSIERVLHSNLVPLLDAGRQDDGVFVVTEHVPGETLAVHVRGAPLEPAQAVNLLIPACAGLAGAHAAGVVHGALEPSNLIVCLDPGGRAVDTKVLHVGIGARLRDAGIASSLAREGAAVATPIYLAPEQLGLDPTLDARTDVYTLGVILYELLAARLPYDTNDMRAMENAIVRGAIMPLEVRRGDLADGLYEAVATALATDPAERHVDVAAFARAIEPFATRRFHAPGVLGAQPGWAEAVVEATVDAAGAGPVEVAAQGVGEPNKEVDEQVRRAAWMGQHWPLAAAVFALVVLAIAWTLATEPTEAVQAPSAVPVARDKPVPPSTPEVALPASQGVAGAEPEASAAELERPAQAETPTARTAPRKRRARRASATPTWTPIADRAESGTARDAPTPEPLKVRTRDGRVRPSEF